MEDQTDLEAEERQVHSSCSLWTLEVGGKGEDARHGGRREREQWEGEEGKDGETQPPEEVDETKEEAKEEEAEETNSKKKHSFCNFLFKES